MQYGRGFFSLIFFLKIQRKKSKYFHVTQIVFRRSAEHLDWMKCGFEQHILQEAVKSARLTHVQHLEVVFGSISNRFEHSDINPTQFDSRLVLRGEPSNQSRAWTRGG